MTGRSDRSTRAAEELITLAARRNPTGRTRVLGIEGRSGSGKTTFAEVVADAVARTGAARPQVLHLDAVYPGWDGLAATPALVAQALRPLAQRRPGAVPTWDWAASAPGPLLTIEAAEWLVVEGVGCGAAVVRPYLTALAWLTAGDDTRFERAIARDGDLYLPHWERWAAQERALLAVEDVPGVADVVLRTDEPAPGTTAST